MYTSAGFSYPADYSDKTPRIYISGPMRGYDQDNYPAFDAVRDLIVRFGGIAFSPADLDRASGDTGFKSTIDTYMDRDMSIIRRLQPGRDKLYLLWGWEKSKGARAEKAYAEVREIVTVKPEDWGCPGRPVDFKAAEEARKDMPVMHDCGPAVTNPASAAIRDGEVRVTDATTGGQKGMKTARFDLMPPHFLWELAELYGRGARKYADRNWEKGYKWGLNIGALQRHLNLWIRGNERDEDGNHHLACVAWHAAALFTFQKFSQGTDDRSAFRD